MYVIISFIESKFSCACANCVLSYDLYDFPSLVQEKYLFYLFSRQHGPLKVKLVYNAMESFQQKAPPISFGAFEDIFD
jgi:hypothetical protein